MRRCVDLFSGIGGFSLACKANGIETACFVEKDQRCRDFLAKAWPGVPIYDDVKTFDGTEWANAFLLTGGVPCQPASRAGKQRGAADDRWLWPDAVRVLGEARPAWVLYENPPGIGDVGLTGILTDVEAQGYAVRVYGIPACAVGSPQRRMRYWIVGKRMGQSVGNRSESGQPAAEAARYRSSAEPATGGDLADAERDGRRLYQSKRGPQGRSVDGGAGESHLADADITGPQGPDAEPGTHGLCAERGQSLWSDYVWVPGADGKLRRAPGDSFRLVDGLHRSVLGALGNSICWPVAARIIEAMCESGEEP